eukprot:9566238-Lingulodinium_polyedra.AAC.1
MPFNADGFNALSMPFYRMQWQCRFNADSIPTQCRLIQCQFKTNADADSIARARALHANTIFA